MPLFVSFECDPLSAETERKKRIHKDCGAEGIILSGEKELTISGKALKFNIPPPG